MEKYEKNKESGNVLFLILIAVALFAALSYAVTQSSRSGGSGTDEESNLINSSVMTQYPAALRTAILRMSISGGVDATLIEFNPPSDSDNCQDFGADDEHRHCLFSPDGGGATYQEGWVFNRNNQIDGIGSTTTAEAPDAENADLIAFFQTSQGICEKVHDELGLGAIPTETGIDVTTQQVNSDGSGSGLEGFTQASTIGVQASSGEVLEGQPFGCFLQGDYYYYHTLAER